MPSYFDAHSHLPSGGTRPPEHLRVVCGTGPEDWGAVLAHAAGDPQVVPMLGLHPWQVAEAPLDWAGRLEDLLRTHRAGVGECGLDFARQTSDRLGQEAALRIQLRLAHALARPVALHAVQAWGRLAALLREEGVPAAGAMMHAFSGSPETARELQALGLHLSFSGNLADPGRPRLREALLAVAPDRLLLESDGAADFPAVVAAAADLLARPVGEVAALTSDNGRRCFKEVLA